MNVALWLAVSSVVWGGVLCLAAMLLQRNSDLSGRMRQWIWRSAMVLLIAPWLAAPVVSMLGLGLAPAETVAMTAPAELVQQAPAVVATIDQASPDASWIVREDSRWMPQGLSLTEALLLIVMLGWVVRFVLAQLSARTLMGIVANSEIARAGPARRALEAWSARLKLGRQPELRFAPGNVSPFSYGIFRPVIVLPEGLDHKLDAKALDLVVGHECLHVARGDGWLRPLERVLADMMWFNPFAWVMRREADVARELAVDEGVVAISNSRRAYARALRDVAGLAVGLAPSLPAASMSLAGSGRSLVLRMQRTLALAKRKPARAAILAAVVLGAAGACTSVGQAMLVTPATPQTSRATVDVEAGPSLTSPEPVRINVSDDQTPVAPVAPQTPARAPQAPPASSNEPMRGATRPVLNGEATLISPWGLRVDPFNPGKTAFHTGVDLKQSWGAPVHAPAEGTVTFAGVDGSNGRVVDIAMADGYSIRLGHLNSFSVETGDKVEAGQKIGSMGSTGRSTGPHLHLEVLRGGKNYNPQDIPGLIFADTLTVALDTPPALPPAAPTVTPDLPPSPSPTPIMFPQQTPQQGVQQRVEQIRAPFAAQVIEARQASDTTAIVGLRQIGPGPGYPLKAFPERCELRLVMDKPTVTAGQMIAEGDVVGEGKSAGMTRNVRCFTVMISTGGDTEAPPRLEGATHPVVASPARYTSGFGYRTDPFNAGKTELHSGIDIAKELGALIYAPAAATVWRAEADPELGNVVVLAIEGGYTLRFGRLAEIKVKRGDTLKAGDILGTMGSTGLSSTGTHLHFETFWNGRAYNPEVVPGLTMIGPT